MGYIVGLVCGMAHPKIVLMAAVSTLLMTVALTLYAFTTKNDFTVCGAMLWVCTAAMIIFGIFISFTDNKMAMCIYNCFGVMIYGFYLIYDTQLIAGGKMHELDYDDY